MEVECLATASWYELAEDTKEDILARLPPECLCRSRAVCKEWNALSTSTKFITNKWAEALPNKKPWLVLCKENNGRGGSVNCWRYCFFTRTWKNISFSFLPRGDEKVLYIGSAQGLFLVDIPYGINTVCNPLTRTFLELPPMSSIQSLMARGIVGWRVDTQETYKVVAVGLSRPNDVLKVEIYDSFNKSWRVVGCLPENLTMPVAPQQIVFCDGFFYCMISNRGAGMGVLGFSILEGTFTFTALPDLVDGIHPRPRIRLGPQPRILFNLGTTINPKLLSCGSRILLAASRGRSALTEVFLWEFQNDSSSWKEIAKSSCEGIRSFECVGVEDCVYFADCQCKNFAVYNLNEDTWSWLPTIDAEYRVQRLMAFKPRPDRKVW